MVQLLAHPAVIKYTSVRSCMESGSIIAKCVVYLQFVHVDIEVSE